MIKLGRLLKLPHGKRPAYQVIPIDIDTRYAHTAYMNLEENRIYALVGKRIKAYRVAAGITQADLAHSLTLQRTSITNIEAGKQKLLLHQLYKICSALNIEVDVLLPTTTELFETVVSPQHGDIEQVPPLAAAVLQDILQED